MKRSISLVLCITLIISMFSMMSVSASAAEPSEIAKEIFTVKEGYVVDGKITYTVYINPGVKLSGAVIYAKFDPEVFEVSGGAYKVTDNDGDTRAKIPGEYVEGLRDGIEDEFAIGHVYDPTKDYNTGTAQVPYMKFTFKAINPLRPASEIEFYCDEYDSISDKANRIENGSNANISNFTISSLSIPSMVSVSNTTGGLKITWINIKGATGYTVYRSVDGKTWDEVETVDGFDPLKSGDELSVVDKNVKNNVKYRYRVRSFNDSGKCKQDASKYMTGRYLMSPATIKLKKSSTSITVSWTKVEGASSYRVYRRIVNADGSYGSWSTLKSGIKELSYKDSSISLTTARKYQYSVRSFASDAASVHTSFATTVFVPKTKVTLKTLYNGVSLTWTKINGVEGYRVLRQVSGGDWVLLDVVKPTVTSFKDTKATSNKQNNYRVVAVADGVKSSYDTNSINYLKAPTPKASNATSGIKVTWTKMSGAKQYVVYRKAGTAKSWTKIATVTGTSYTDKSVKSGTTYKYTVKAYNGKVYSGYNPDGAKIIRLATPKISSASSSKSGITLKWSKMAGADSYVIYRRVGSGSWSTVATVKGASKVTYLDKTAKKGTTYTYRIRSYRTLDGVKYSSGYSSTVNCKDKY